MLSRSTFGRGTYQEASSQIRELVASIHGIAEKGSSRKLGGKLGGHEKSRGIENPGGKSDWTWYRRGVITLPAQ
jgi:hypothetical protein